MKHIKINKNHHSQMPLSGRGNINQEMKNDLSLPAWTGNPAVHKGNSLFNMDPRLPAAPGMTPKINNTHKEDSRQKHSGMTAEFNNNRIIAQSSTKPRTQRRVSYHKKSPAMRGKK
jgi:hypothetical protein